MDMKRTGNGKNGTPQDAAPLSLLAEIRAGKRVAFSRLVLQYDPLLRARASAFGHTPSDEADAYQEACLALYRAAIRYREGGGVSFGLFAKICIDNALKNWYRKCHTAASSQDPLVDFVPFEEAGLHTEFSDRMVEEEQVGALLEQIAEALSPYEWRVFTSYIEGLCPADIAKQMGRGEKSVRNAVSRILRKLRVQFGRTNMPQ